MSRAGVIRVAGFVVPAAGALFVLFATADWRLFGLALIAVIIIGIPVEYAYRRVATPEEQRRDLEDRVRNPPG